MLNSPRTFLGTEPARLRGVLADLNRVLSAADDASLNCRIELHADDLIAQLEASIERVREAKAAVEAEWAVAMAAAPELLDAHEAMASYIGQAQTSFDADPPSTDFQRGYLAAIEEVRAQHTGSLFPPSPKQRESDHGLRR